ncbi:MAG: superoxide dismutase [Bacteroidaceae bacterium]|nr:superoxide dismutase [Bacteroidaceae bacterium]
MNCLTALIVSVMSDFMPTLPYDADALEPVISKETIEYHYGKHLKTYADNLSKLTRGTALEGKSIEEIVVDAPEGAIYNNAGQVMNHQLYFLQFTPAPRISRPEGKLATLIVRDFGSFEELQKKMNEASTKLFGSGWVWLCLNDSARLEVDSYSNGDTPLRYGKLPVLGFDVWEHAYYLDYQNRRADHIGRLWEIIDWDEVTRRIE